MKEIAIMILFTIAFRGIIYYGIEKVNKTVTKHHQLESLLIPIGDGLTLLIVKK